jgi:hypothetical protein
VASSEELAEAIKTLAKGAKLVVNGMTRAQVRDGLQLAGVKWDGSKWEGDAKAGRVNKSYRLGDASFTYFSHKPMHGGGDNGRYFVRG